MSEERASDAHPLVGRHTALCGLRAALERASTGVRAIVFLTGEPGIGKTRLLDAFLGETSARPGLRAARGQCVEHFGAGEPYGPVLEALGRLCRGPGGDDVVALLSRLAPTWLAQMPWLLKAGEGAAIQHDTLGASAERMLREMTEALEALTVESPLVLVLEDIHWADGATLDLVACIARRPEAARLLVIATYRPVETILRGGALRVIAQEALLRGHASEQSLEPLTEADVAEYLAVRFPGSAFPDALARHVHGRTDGNPLFMVHVVDFLLAQGSIVHGDGAWQPAAALDASELGVPDSLREMIERQIERTGADAQPIIEAAAVAGTEFALVSVAAATGLDPLRVEKECEALARRGQLLERRGTREWPDGTLTPIYRFIHSLYAQVLYDRTPLLRRLQLHNGIGAREEAGYGERGDEVAAQLASHFERGRDYPRALRHLRGAAENAARRFAIREATAHLTHALDLATLIAEADRPLARIDLLERRGAMHRAVGDMLPAAEDFTAMAVLAREHGHGDLEVQALLLVSSGLGLVDRRRCLAAADEAVARSAAVGGRLMSVVARGYQAYWNQRARDWRAEDAAAAAAALEAVRPLGLATPLAQFLCIHGSFQGLRSAYREACESAGESQRLALAVGDAFTYQIAIQLRSTALLALGRWGEMRRNLMAGLAMAERNGHHMSALISRLQLASLHLEACAFESAKQMSETGITAAERAGHGYGLVLGELVRGQAELGLGNPAAATSALVELAERLEREPLLMEWALQLPLHAALGEAWLARGALDRARAAATRACELAAQPGERAWLARGHRTLAEVALAAPQLADAERELSCALDALTGAEAPLAAWRVYATAARLEQARDRERMADWRSRARTLVHQLASSLGDADDLQQALLAAPEVRALSSGP